MLEINQTGGEMEKSLLSIFLLASMLCARSAGAVVIQQPQPQAILNHDDEVRHVAFSPDGTLLATASLDSTAKLWNTANGELLATLEHELPVWEVAFSPNDERLATLSVEAVFFFLLDVVAMLWDVPQGNLVGVLQHDSLVVDVAFNPDGSMIATASWDSTAKLWNTANGELLATLKHDASVNAVSFSPDGSTIVTSSRSADFSPDGSMILTRGTAKLWDTANGGLLSTLADGPVALWAATDGSLLATFEGDLRLSKLSPDGTRIITGSGLFIPRPTCNNLFLFRPGTADLWEAPAGQFIATLEEDGVVLDVSFSPDGSKVVTASSNGTAKVWNAVTGELLLTLNHSCWVLEALFSPDGELVATRSNNLRTDVYQVVVWKASGGGAVADLRHDDRIRDVEFSPDGTMIATASRDKTAKLWPTGTGIINAVEEEEALPERFTLFQNYPNPFNPTTTIAYKLPTRAEVRLVVYDLYGREVATLVNETNAAGRHEVRFEAGNLASGVYFYRIEAGTLSVTKQLVLLK